MYFRKRRAVETVRRAAGLTHRLLRKIGRFLPYEKTIFIFRTEYLIEGFLIPYDWLSPGTKSQLRKGVGLEHLNTKSTGSQ